jgi:hypothetical protein
MSYIRTSTKVPGQKNTSRAYAWHDAEGGIFITTQRVPVAGRSAGEVLLSFPEFYFMATRFLTSFEQYYKRKGESVTAALSRFHRGFYEKFDKKADKAHRALMKKLQARNKQASDQQKRYVKQFLNRLRRRKSRDKIFKERAEREAMALFLKEEARILQRKVSSGRRGTVKS